MDSRAGSVASYVRSGTPAGKIVEQIRTSVTQPEIPEEGDFVRIMSLQKSKGLTSKVVIVAGCVEALFLSRTGMHLLLNRMRLSRNSVDCFMCLSPVRPSDSWFLPLRK